RSHGRVLGGGDAAPGSPQVRVLLRREGGVPRGIAGGNPPPRPRVGATARGRTDGDPGAAPSLPSLQRPPRAAPVPGSVLRGGRGARAPSRRRGRRRGRVPAQLPGARAAVRTAGAAPEPRIRLADPLCHG